jgi:hypothetical protein
MPFAPSETPKWDQIDTAAFLCLIDLEGSLPMLEGEVSADVEGRFPDVARLHATLPFSDDERRWLLEGRDLGWESIHVEYENLQRGKYPADRMIIKYGERHGVDGGDLVRRWASWRRRLDEYANHDSLEEARQALEAIGREMLPGGSRPDLPR